MFSICVLISGGGTTLKNLIDYRQRNDVDWEIGHVISNNPTAGGLQHATDAGIDCEVINHRDFESAESFSHAIFQSIKASDTDLVVMGGFLRRLKIDAGYENRIVNIHPSLIPAFCGHGHYGMRVHRSVLEYGCKLTGCTVHYVDDQYDHGPIIAQSAVPVLSGDTPEQLAARVFTAECELYPRVIQAIASGRITIDQRNVSVDW